MRCRPRLLAHCVAALAVAALAAAFALPAVAAPRARAADATPGGVLTTFVQAAGKGDAAKLWSLLSPQSQKRLGPDLAAFKKKAAASLNQGLGGFSRDGSFKVRFSTVLSSSWAVAVITGTRKVDGKAEAGAYGVVMRATAGAWRLELGGPVQVRVLGPDPGETVASPGPQVAVEAKAPRQIVGAIIWADGEAVNSSAGGTGPNNVTIYGVAPNVTGKGIHWGAGVAATATDATAVAWTFGLVPAGGGKLPTGIKGDVAGAGAPLAKK